METVKESKTKTKCVVFVAAVVIALGAIKAITGCETKKCTKALEMKAAEKAPAKK